MAIESVQVTKTYRLWDMVQEAKIKTFNQDKEKIFGIFAKSTNSDVTAFVTDIKSGKLEAKDIECIKKLISRDPESAFKLCESVCKINSITQRARINDKDGVHSFISDVAELFKNSSVELQDFLKEINDPKLLAAIINAKYEGKDQVLTKEDAQLIIKAIVEKSVQRTFTINIPDFNNFLEKLSKLPTDHFIENFNLFFNTPRQAKKRTAKAKKSLMGFLVNKMNSTKSIEDKIKLAQKCKAVGGTDHRKSIVENFSPDDFTQWEALAKAMTTKNGFKPMHRKLLLNKFVKVSPQKKYSLDNFIALHQALGFKDKDLLVKLPLMLRAAPDVKDGKLSLKLTSSRDQKEPHRGLYDDNHNGSFLDF